MKDSNKLSLEKKERLRGQKNFFNLLKKGNKCRKPYLKVFCFPNELDYNRIVIIISSKLGNSCFRNKVRRVIKEIYRVHKNEFSQGYDIGFRLLDGNFSLLNFNEKKSIIFSCLRKLSLLK